MTYLFTWRPIETAPKDGTLILLTSGEASGVGRWSVIASRDTLNDVSVGGEMRAVFAREYGWHSRADKWLKDAVPTHWSPIPPLEGEGK